MPTAILCPTCGVTLWVEERLLHSQVQCGHCYAAFTPAVQEPIGSVGLPILAPVDRDRHAGKAVASLVLGCIGLIGWCLPIFGVPITITGLVLGIKGINSRYHGQAIAGITLSVIGLMLSVANAAIGAYQVATGQHPLFQ